jgi:hypothetical protein
MLYRFERSSTAACGQRHTVTVAPDGFNWLDAPQANAW